jgi:hypothetical protein
MFGSYRSHFLSRKSLTASQNEAKEKWKVNTANRDRCPLPSLFDLDSAPLSPPRIEAEKEDGLYLET